MRIQNQKKEKDQLSSPVLSSHSRLLVGQRQGKIEDRLLSYSKKREVFEADSPERIPEITEYAKKIKPEKPVVERLLMKGDIYLAKKKNKDPYSEYTFVPRINSYSNNVSRSDLSSPKAKPKFEQNFSFQPEINKNSSAIASKLGPFGSRNTSRTRSLSIEEYSFKPIINQNSSENLSKTGEERWKQLYDLNLQRRERLALMRQTFAESEKDFECTFHPKTCKPQNRVDSSLTAQRLYDWESRRLARLSQVKESSTGKDSDECTFRPYLYGNIACQTTFTDFYAELERKKKKTYTDIHRSKFIPDKIEWRSDKVAPLFISDINSSEYDEAIKELHDMLHVGLKRN